MTANAYDPTKYSFYWRDKSYKCNPVEAAKEFYSIESENGAVTPEFIVVRARKKSSPLHNDFTWNKTQAASKWLKHEARNMIGSLVRVHVENGEDTGRRHRGFVNVRVGNNTERSYLNVDTVMQDPILSSKVLNFALMKAQHWLDEFWAYRGEFDMQLPYENVQQTVGLLQDAVARRTAEAITESADAATATEGSEEQSEEAEPQADAQ